MDHLHERLEALEQRTHTVERQLRWWRGLACGLLGLAVLTWALPVGTAQETAQSGGKGLEQRVSALESLLKHFSRKGNEVFIKGANLHILNGLGSTDCTDDQFEPIPDCPNGLGNLIVGYNESRTEVPDCESAPTDPFCIDTRTGSHNVVVGRRHNFSRFGGIVVGDLNTISGDFAVVSGGRTNTASGTWSVISGGHFHTASGLTSSVSGGSDNTASGFAASVSGGRSHTAGGDVSAVSGGEENTASGFAASVTGGLRNTAGGGTDPSEGHASVSGGQENTASGLASSVSGGHFHTASGLASSVSGGFGRTAPGEFDWVAGSLFQDD